MWFPGMFIFIFGAIFGVFFNKEKKRIKKNTKIKIKWYQSISYEPIKGTDTGTIRVIRNKITGKRIK